MVVLENFSVDRRTCPIYYIMAEGRQFMGSVD
jgi:hypothetical protein